MPETSIQKTRMRRSRKNQPAVKKSTKSVAQRSREYRARKKSFKNAASGVIIDHANSVDFAISRVIQENRSEDEVVHDDRCINVQVDVHQQNSPSLSEDLTASTVAGQRDNNDAEVRITLRKRKKIAKTPAERCREYRLRVKAKGQRIVTAAKTPAQRIREYRARRKFSENVIARQPTTTCSNRIWENSNEQLIELLEMVYKHEVLYDWTHEHHFDDTHIANVWNEIGQHTGYGAHQCRLNWHEFCKKFLTFYNNTTLITGEKHDLHEEMMPFLQFIYKDLATMKAEEVLIAEMTIERAGNTPSSDPFIIALINRVFEYRELYDTNHPMYHDDIYTGNIWKQIAARLNCTGESCKTMWTATKTTFFKFYTHVTLVWGKKHALHDLMIRFVPYMPKFLEDKRNRSELHIATQNNVEEGVNVKDKTETSLDFPDIIEIKKGNVAWQTNSNVSNTESNEFANAIKQDMISIDPSVDIASTSNFATDDLMETETCFDVPDVIEIRKKGNMEMVKAEGKTPKSSLQRVFGNRGRENSKKVAILPKQHAPEEYTGTLGLWNEQLKYLLQIVSKHEVLYDRSHARHFDDAHISNVWDKIGRQTGYGTQQCRINWHLFCNKFLTFYNRKTLITGEKQDLHEDMIPFLPAIYKDLTTMKFEKDLIQDMQTKDAGKIPCGEPYITLINCIYQHRELYDENHPLYHDEKHTLNIWAQIKEAVRFTEESCQIMWETTHKMFFNFYTHVTLVTGEKHVLHDLLVRFVPFLPQFLELKRNIAKQHTATQSDDCIIIDTDVEEGLNVNVDKNEIISIESTVSTSSCMTDNSQTKAVSTRSSGCENEKVVVHKDRVVQVDVPQQITSQVVATPAATAVPVPLASGRRPPFRDQRKGKKEKTPAQLRAEYNAWKRCFRTDADPQPTTRNCAPPVVPRRVKTQKEKARDYREWKKFENQYQFTVESPEEYAMSGTSSSIRPRRLSNVQLKYLILIVFKHKELYDWSDERHFDEMHISNVWDEVGKQTGYGTIRCRYNWHILCNTYLSFYNKETLRTGEKHDLHEEMMPFLPFIYKDLTAMKLEEDISRDMYKVQEAGNIPREESYITLINCIYQYRELYDDNHPLYHDDCHKLNIWKQIGADTSYSVESCKAKWMQTQTMFSTFYKHVTLVNGKRHVLHDLLVRFVPYLPKILDRKRKNPEPHTTTQDDEMNVNSSNMIDSGDEKDLYVNDVKGEIELSVDTATTSNFTTDGNQTNVDCEDFVKTETSIVFPDETEIKKEDLACEQNSNVSHTETELQTNLDESETPRRNSPHCAQCASSTNLPSEKMTKAERNREYRERKKAIRIAAQQRQILQQNTPENQSGICENIPMIIDFPRPSVPENVPNASTINEGYVTLTPTERNRKYRARLKLAKQSQLEQEAAIDMIWDDFEFVLHWESPQRIPNKSPEDQANAMKGTSLNNRTRENCNQQLKEVLKLVYKYTELYDSSHECHFDYKHISNVWDEIGRQTGFGATRCRLSWHALCNKFLTFYNRETLITGEKHDLHEEMMPFLHWIYKDLKAMQVEEILIDGMRIQEAGIDSSGESYITLTDWIYRYKALYDMSHPMYHDDHHTLNIWKKIGEKICCTAESCKMMWEKTQKLFFNFYIHVTLVTGEKNVLHDSLVRFLPYLLQREGYNTAPHTVTRNNDGTATDALVNEELMEIETLDFPDIIEIKKETTANDMHAEDDINVSDVKKENITIEPPVSTTSSTNLTTDDLQGNLNELVRRTLVVQHQLTAKLATNFPLGDSTAILHEDSPQLIAVESPEEHCQDWAVRPQDLDDATEQHSSDEGPDNIRCATEETCRNVDSREFDNQQLKELLDVVYKHEVLYDWSHKRHFDDTYISNVWDEVGRQTGYGAKRCRLNWHAFCKKFLIFYNKQTLITGEKHDLHYEMIPFLHLIYKDLTAMQFEEELLAEKKLQEAGNIPSKEPYITLINCIYQYRELYDENHPMYKDDNYTLHIWKKIGEQINCTVASCKAKWMKTQAMFFKFYTNVTVVTGKKHVLHDSLVRFVPYLPKFRDFRNNTIPHVVSQNNEGNLNTIQNDLNHIEMFGMNSINSETDVEKDENVKKEIITIEQSDDFQTNSFKNEEFVKTETCIFFPDVVDVKMENVADDDAEVTLDKEPTEIAAECANEFREESDANMKVPKTAAERMRAYRARKKLAAELAAKKRAEEKSKRKTGAERMRTYRARKKMTATQNAIEPHFLSNDVCAEKYDLENDT